MKDGDKAVMAFHYATHALMIADIDMPIPQGDIDSAAPRSWMWKTAAEEMKAHKAHAITMCVPAGDAILEALAVSRLLCAAAAASQKADQSVGIYWGNGAQVHSIPFFTDAVQSMAHDDTLPVMLWVGLAISGESERGPFTLTTCGLPAFGHKEIEIIDTTKTIGELRMMTYELINYLLTRGPILQHGQTFGSSESERFKIEHTTSRFRKGDPVIRLHIP
jgi:hypothetical protein